MRRASRKKKRGSPMSEARLGGWNGDFDDGRRGLLTVELFLDPLWGDHAHGFAIVITSSKHHGAGAQQHTDG